MRIVCQQTILMKFIFVIFEKAAKFEIVVCCKFYVAFYGLRSKGGKTFRWTFFILMDYGIQ